jgi:hypothetical protein
VEARKDKPGAHALGRAVDILVNGEEAYLLLCAALGHGFTGIGINQTGSRETRFIHLDDMRSEDGFSRPHLWSY